MTNSPEEAKYWAMKSLLDENAPLDKNGQLKIYGEIQATLENMKITPEMIERYEKGRGIVSKNERIKMLNNVQKKYATKFLGVGEFNRETDIFAPNECLIFQKETYGTHAESSFFQIEYNLYKIFTGTGNRPKFIWCNQTDKIDIGESKQYLLPLDSLEFEEIVKDLRNAKMIVEFVDKHTKLKVFKKDATTEDYEKLLIEDHNKQPLFFKKTLPVPLTELCKIEDFYNFTMEALTQDVNIDKNLVDCYIAQIPEVNPKLIKPNTFMKSANHQIYITNAGVGKTSLAVAITGEPTIVDCSSANLLGFSTGDTKVSGKLDRRTKPLIIEEVQELKEDETLGQLLTYEEQGETERAKGQGIKCRGHSSIIYQGNPKFKQEDENLSKFLMTKAVRDFFSKISSNSEAFGRRKGDIEIGLDYSVVVGTGINEDKMNKTSQIIRSIAEGFRDPFTDLLLQERVFEWLNKSHDEKYTSQIDGLIKNCNDNVITGFLKGQKLNYRHLKGGALSRAWLKVGINKVLEEIDGKVSVKIKPYFEDEDLDEILECAETFYENRKLRNFRSMANILSLVDSPEYNKILEMDIKGMKPEYLKLLVCSLLRCKLRGNTDKIININEVEEDFNHLRVTWGVSGKYQYFSRIKEPFEKHLSQFKNILENFGLEYDKSISSFVMQDTELFNKKLEAYKEIIRGTIDTNGTGSTIDTGSTK